MCLLSPFTMCPPDKDGLQCDPGLPLPSTSHGCPAHAWQQLSALVQAMQPGAGTQQPAASSSSLPTSMHQEPSLLVEDRLGSEGSQLLATRCEAART